MLASIQPERYAESEVNPMRNVPPLKAGLFLVVSFVLCGQSAPQQSEGVRARSGPADYSAQVSLGKSQVAATLVPADQVKHAFAYDISKQYAVIEVAVYPNGRDSIAIHNGDFSIKLPAQLAIVRSAEPETVAADLQARKTPNRIGRSIPVYTEANVGYESGTDPDTGRRGHSVYTGVGVGVGGPPVPSFPAPGGYPQDRALLEDQLFRKSLPEGPVTKPIAGYIYFPLADLKKVKSAYNVEFRSNDTQQPMVSLTVPIRAK